MAKRFTLEILMDLAKAIGANPNKFMGTRSNISFLGKGPTRNPLFQQPLDFLGPEGRGITVEALGDRGKLISAVEDAMGYASSGKLNPIQTEMLGSNLKGIYEILHPPVLPSASVTNIAPGIEGLRRFPKESHQFFGRPLKDADFAKIDRLVAEGKLPPAKGVGGLDLPQKTHSARATMIRLLDVHAGGQEGVGITLREMMSPKELKWLMEGGGGTKGDPITLFTKFYGNAATRNLPSEGTPAVIDAFAKRLMRAKDTMGRKIDDPFFRPEEVDFAHGGLAHILQVPRSGYSKGRAVKSLMGIVNKKFVKDTLKKASDVASSTKYDDLAAVNAFERRQMIRNKYQGLIDDDLLNKILIDDNPQRIAEVLATIDEALLMQNIKGMGPESIIASFKESWKRKPSASGGLARILEI